MPLPVFAFLSLLLLCWLRLAVRALARDRALSYRTLMESASLLRQLGLVSSAASFAIAFHGRVDPDGVSRILADAMTCTATALGLSFLLQLLAGRHRRYLEALEAAEDLSPAPRAERANPRRVRLPRRDRPKPHARWRRYKQVRVMPQVQAENGDRDRNQGVAV